MGKETALLNTNGLQQIITALTKYHKHGAPETLMSGLVRAYAVEAEEGYPNGGVQFEISAVDTLSSRPEVIHITPEGYDVAIFAEDEAS